MPSMTLLEVVQDVSSDTGLDEVTSILDTIESQQVANIVKGCWQEIQDLYDLPARAEFFQLANTTVTAPTLLSMPDTVQHIEFIEYDSKESLTDPVSYSKLTYLEPLAFFVKSNSLNEDDAEVELITHSSGVSYKVFNDRAPSYYTVYNNKYVLCDAYNSALDTSVDGALTRCLGLIEAQWDNTDAAVIELDNNLMQLLLEKSKARVFSRLRRMTDADTERAARRLEIRATKTKDKLRGSVRYPNYGR